MVPERMRPLRRGASIKLFSQARCATAQSPGPETRLLFGIGGAKRRMAAFVKTLAMLTALVASAEADAQLPAQGNVTVGGYLQYDQSTVFEPEALSSGPNGDLRRARIGFAAKGFANFSAKAEVNIDEDGDVDPTSLYIDVTPSALPFALRIGHFNTPNSLDHLTSSRFTSLTERAAFRDSFDFKRRVGVAVSSKAETYHWSLAFFGDNLNDGTFGNGYSAAARGAVTPIRSDQHLLHLGVSARYRRSNEEGGLVYSLSPSFAPDEAARRLSAGGRSDMFAGVEAAYVADSFWLAGEYGALRPFGGEGGRAALTGGYVEAGVAVGGQRVFRNGRFMAPQVDRSVLKGGPGAVLAVVRYDAIGLANNEDIDGFGTIALGIDWIATRHVQLRLNVFSADAGRLLNAPADLTLPGILHETDNGGSGRTRGLQLRFQLIL